MEEGKVSIKHREIVFRGPYAPHLNPEAALLLLTDAKGVKQVTLLDENRISISYDLHTISLLQIETALSESGFHLDNSILTKIKRALYYFAEDTERKNHGLETLTCSGGCAAKIFVASYKKRQHGCRDQRPDHLRRYL